MPAKAFCVLLFVSNGGQVDERGKPIFKRGWRTRGNCRDPGDCDGCPLMQQELAKYAPSSIMWVCPVCIRELTRQAKEQGMSFLAPGYFTEGLCQYEGCSRPARTEGGEELPARYSHLLQLFIRN